MIKNFFTKEETNIQASKWLHSLLNDCHQQKTRVFESGPIFRQIPWVQNKTSLFVRNLQINQHQVIMSKRKAPSDENPNADFVDFLFELANYEKNVNRNVFKHNAYRF